MTHPDDDACNDLKGRILITGEGRSRASDPLGALIGLLPPDPLIADFIALRRAPPDLHEAAFRASAHAAEAFKLAGFEHLREVPDGDAAVVGLEILAACYEAEVAIWPSDTGEHAVAKVALHPEPSHQSSLRRDGMARYLRIILAALNPGFQQLPAPRQPPRLDERAFEPRPDWAFDLPSELSALPKEASYGLSNHVVLARLTFTEPDLLGFTERAAACFQSCDALFLQSLRDGPDMQDLRAASEGAMIAAYALCAQVGLWPGRKHSTDREAKVRVQGLVNARAVSRDPLHMIAAVQLAFIRSEQPLKYTPPRYDQRPLETPWVENV